MAPPYLTRGGNGALKLRSRSLCGGAFPVNLKSRGAALTAPAVVVEIGVAGNRGRGRERRRGGGAGVVRGRSPLQRKFPILPKCGNPLRNTVRTVRTLHARKQELSSHTRIRRNKPYSGLNCAHCAHRPTAPRSGRPYSGTRPRWPGPSCGPAGRGFFRTWTAIRPCRALHAGTSACSR